jgi:hypothetical protein
MQFTCPRKAIQLHPTSSFGTPNNNPANTVCWVGLNEPSAGIVEASIADYLNFEHLEAEGQRLMPEQLKTILKALARSNLL